MTYVISHDDACSRNLLNDALQTGYSESGLEQFKGAVIVQSEPAVSVGFVLPV